MVFVLLRKVFVFNEALVIKSKKYAKAFFYNPIIKGLRKAGGNFLKRSFRGFSWGFLGENDFKIAPIPLRK